MAGCHLLRLWSVRHPSRLVRRHSQDVRLLAELRPARFLSASSSAPSRFLSWSSGWQPLTSCGARGLHTSRPRQTVYWYLSAKVVAAVAGRFFGRWWRRQPRPSRESLRTGLGVAALGAAWVCVLATAYYRSHVQETPLTHRRRFLALTPAQMAAICKAQNVKHMRELLEKKKLVSLQDPDYTRLRAILNRLLDAARHLVDSTDRKWTLHVVLDDNVNASADQNGNIYVNTGLLKFVGDNDNQLAVVMAHEMAHALLMHQMEVLSFARLVDWLIIVSMAAIWTVIPNDGIAVVTQWFFHKVTKLVLSLPYNRKLEREADKVGMLLLAKACFDVRWQEVFWARLRLQQTVTKGVQQSEWLSTHPHYTRRESDVRFYLPMVMASVCGQCGPMPEADPMTPVRALEAKVNNYVTAVKSYQNLRRMPVEK